MRPHGSFSDFVRKSSYPCAAARPRRIEVAASSVQASQRDASESRSLTKAPRLRRPLWVCAVERRRFPVGARPTRQRLQPEATGAVMEETKWLKPSVSVSRIGDSASVQAVTRVNAEQASKRTMPRPTRQPFRGRLIRLGEAERRVRPAAAPG